MSNSLVVYDSVFGNTHKIAVAISEGLAERGTSVVRAVVEVTPEDLIDLQTLVVGSPTRGFRATQVIIEWINSLPISALSAVKVAAFDTRIPEATIKSNLILRLLGGMVKYAVDQIAKSLQAKMAGGEMPKNWFYVADSKGPLLEGELDRAYQWGEELAG
ncbi:MAG: hypothetical protein BGO78_06240 [Chloroflexi bacterium 44-23]|nr:MAG: hypothetical protein BGO78_06240 [Chloroflexi bacterium 44-23]